jgi:trans-2,3-dihydro-3-hydroxyanthranilate isomerase
LKYDYVLLDVFSDSVFGGNQLAVLPNATGLSAQTMQAIAREFNFAETAFVLPAERPTGTRRLRIFSPGSEMPFAGHPTVGAAAALVQLGVVPAADGHASMILEETAGDVQVVVRDEGRGLHGELTLRPVLQTGGDSPGSDSLAAALTLPAGSVVRSWLAGVGVPFCLCQLRTAADVDAAVLDKASWQAALGTTWAQNLFFFAGELRDGAQIHARMFAPAIGIDEDPATGSACAALVALAAEMAGDGLLRLSVRQGVKIGRSSSIAASALRRDGALEHVKVAGDVAFFAEGTLEAPCE